MRGSSSKREEGSSRGEDGMVGALKRRECLEGQCYCAGGGAWHAGGEFSYCIDISSRYRYLLCIEYEWL